MTASYEKLVDAYANKGGFEHLARLYLWNIANGRFAWRNRFQADDMKVEVRFDGQTIVFNPTHPKLSLEVPAGIEDLRASALSNEPATVDKLIAWIAKGLQEKRAALNVAWLASMQEGQEIFPSQEYLQAEKKRRHQAASTLSFRGIGRGARSTKPPCTAKRSAPRSGTSTSFLAMRVIAVNPYGGVQETGAVFEPERPKRARHRQEFLRPSL